MRAVLTRMSPGFPETETREKMVSDNHSFKWPDTGVMFMKLSIPALVLVILGILIVVSPWTFAPVCENSGMYATLANGKTLPMPCGWTARAEIGTGALTIFAGLLLAFAQSAETKRMIGLFGAALGILTILFPLYITKMCAMAEHPCNLLTKPVLALLGVAVIVVSVWVIYTAQKEMAP
jgi:hypothetical protein